MDFRGCTTMLGWTRRADPDDRPAQNIERFYKRALKDGEGMGSAPWEKQA